MPSHSLAKGRSEVPGRDRSHASVTPGAPSSGSEYWTSGANNGPLDHERPTKGRPRLRAFGLNFVSHRHPLIHWVMLLALVVMWGSSFGLTKIAVSTASADSVVAARLLVAGVSWSDCFSLLVSESRGTAVCGWLSWPWPSWATYYPIG